MPAATPARVEVEQQSWLCVTTPPDITGQGDTEVEWYVRTGPGRRRRVERGDHLEPGHELPRLFPDHFRASSEVPDVLAMSVPSAEVLARQEAERRRLMPRFAEVRSWTCLNCGETSPTSPPIEPQLQALDVASALDAAETLADRSRVQFHALRQSNARIDALAAADRIANEFRLSHPQCDPTRELHPLPEMPEYEPGEAIPVWSGPVSFRD